jgi:tetratricopeptide (TPR) repeat protein
MYNIIPFILALLSISVVIYIVAKKFSALAALDIDSIQSEKEAKIKERIIGKKLKRNIVRYGLMFFRFFHPLATQISGFSKWMYGRLVLLRENYAKDTVQISSNGGPQLIERLKIDADNLMQNEEYEAAEKKLIEIIGLDSKDVGIFVKLGHLYFERKNYQEAVQTLEHSLKLCEVQGREGCDLSNIYYDLAQVFESMENIGEAQAYIKKAVNVEPNNPRYLDMKLRISIMLKDKVNALEAFEKLLDVNPENQKLIDFKKQIDEI